MQGIRAKGNEVSFRPDMTECADAGLKRQWPKADCLSQFLASTVV